jgi:PAS domain S-box-containing protein
MRGTPGWRGYAAAVALTVAVVLLCVSIDSWVAGRPILIVFFVPIVICAYWGGFGPGLLATALAGLASDYFAIPPTGSFAFGTPFDFAQWLFLLLVGALISVLFADRARHGQVPREDFAPRSRHHTERKILLGFAISVVFLGAIGIVSFQSVVRLDDNSRLVTRSHLVTAGIEALVATTKEGESAQRAYIITGDEIFATEYGRALARVDGLVGQLRNAAREDLQQLARIDLLAEAVRVRLALSTELLDLRRAGAMAELQARLEQTPNRLGIALQAGIRELARQMEAEESRRLEEREGIARRSTSITQAVIVGGNLLALICLALALFAIRRDFAGRERAESELDRFFSLSLDFLTIASQDGYFKRVSPASSDLLGWTPEEFTDKPWLDFVHPDDVESTIREAQKLKSGQRVLNFENRYRHKDGSWRVLSWRSTPQGDKMYGIARDVTEETRVKQELRDAKEQLEVRVAERTGALEQANNALQRAYDDLRQTQQQVMQQERLGALVQMASGIAHDINNAISPMALYTESLLEREQNLSDRGRKQLEIVQRAVDDVAQTVSRMGEFYRVREPQLSLVPVDLNKIVNQVLDLTRARWSDMVQQRGISIDIRLELADDLPCIAAVECQVRDALVNLVFNAVDAMPQGGPLTLRTRLAAGTGAQTVQLEVADAGTGMDEVTRRRCLEPFFTTKGARGTGLGLAMVYGVVQRHNANLEIKSEPGKGTTVRISFAAAQGAEAVANAVHKPPVGRMRILVIDDEPLLLKSLRDALECEGHDVTSASDGQAGIDAFMESLAAGQPFPLVITDLGMPHVDGRKVAATIKASSPGTVIFMLTGWGKRLITEGEIPHGVDTVLSKPPKLLELRAALANHFSRVVEAGSESSG